MTWGDAQGAGALQEKAPAPLPPLINTSITLFMKYIGFVGNIFHLKNTFLNGKIKRKGRKREREVGEGEGKNKGKEKEKKEKDKAKKGRSEGRRKVGKKEIYMH